MLTNVQMDVRHINLIGVLITCNPPKRHQYKSLSLRFWAKTLIKHDNSSSFEISGKKDCIGVIIYSSAMIKNATVTLYYRLSYLIFFYVGKWYSLNLFHKHLVFQCFYCYIHITLTSDSFEEMTVSFCVALMLSPSLISPASR